MGFSTPFDNQVLLIARLFLASILGQFWDNFFEHVGAHMLHENSEIGFQEFQISCYKRSNK